MTNDKILEDSEYIINNYLRTRIINLRQIITRINSIINIINNNGKSHSLYGSEEKAVIDEFNKKIKDFNLSDKENNNYIFKNWNIISSNIGLNPIPENVKISINQNYFDTSTINNLNNTDCKLIFFLIYQFNKLLDYNTQVGIQSELAHLIIKLTKYSFNQYFRQYSNTSIRKFDFILINEVPYMDDSLKITGFYQELLNNKEVEDKKEKEKDENYDAQQAMESMDIDDYDNEGDDIDGTMEALDNSGD
jgi:hypothetical protein